MRGAILTLVAGTLILSSAPAYARHHHHHDSGPSPLVLALKKQAAEIEKLRKELAEFRRELRPLEVAQTKQVPSSNPVVSSAIFQMPDMLTYAIDKIKPQKFPKLAALESDVSPQSSDSGAIKIRRHHGPDLKGQPEALIAKVEELETFCHAKVISAFRPGARVAGTNIISNHARNTADDLVGDYKCIYAHLEGWKGGYSLDPGRVHHIHISYDRHHEWGARFYHGGGGSRYAHHRWHKHHNYADRRHYRTAYAYR